MPATVPPNRLGQIQGAGDERALFLKLFSGEVLATFERKVATQGAAMVKKITSGKSYQFPAIGRAGVSRFTIGDNILDSTNGYLETILNDERIINVDSPLINALVINEFEEALSHFEVRSEYVKQMAEALAIEHDTHVLSVGIAAARTNLTFAHADYTATRKLNKGAAGLDTAEEIVAGLFEAAEIFDNNDVPTDGRLCFLRPSEYYKVLHAAGGPTVYANADYGTQASIQSARIVTPIAGFEIRMTKNLPSTDKSANNTDAAGTSSNDVFDTNGHGYNGDFSGTTALCIHPRAIGNVQLWDLTTKMEEKLELQGDLVVSRLAEGMGVLRPECAVELSTDV
jgi:hypothetical protein